MSKTNYYLKKICGIYVITHIESNRQYCGQSRDILSRWKAHCSGGKKAVGIGAAIRDEGVDSFLFRVLEECDVYQLNEREVWWIQHNNCVEPHGYNRNSGGGAPTTTSEQTKAKLSASLKGKTKSDEQKAKLSAAFKGKKTKPHSEESKQKISTAGMGRVSPNKGKTFSDDTKAKLSAATKETWRKRKESAEACKDSD